MSVVSDMPAGTPMERFNAFALQALVGAVKAVAAANKGTDVTPLVTAVGGISPVAGLDKLATSGEKLVASVDKVKAAIDAATAELAKQTTELAKISKAMADRNTLIAAQTAEMAKQTTQLTKSATISEQVALKQGVTIKL